jgi:hypothetical protein
MYIHINIYIYIYTYTYKYTVLNSGHMVPMDVPSERRVVPITVHAIHNQRSMQYPGVTIESTPRNGVQTHSKSRNNCKYSILYSQLIRGFEWVCTPFRGVLHFVAAG